MKKIVILIALFSIFLIHCSDDEVSSPSGGGSNVGCNADSIATYWFMETGAMMDSLAHLSKEEVRDLDFEYLRNGYQEALACESNNGIAHLGLSMVEMLEIDYSSELWALIDSIDSWTGAVAPETGYSGGRLLGNQFSLMVQVPLAFNIQRMRTIPDNISMGNVQDIIENTVLPALGASIAHLSAAESQTDMKMTLNVEDDGITDTYIIDAGEILFFDAAMHALKAGFEMAASYDMDLFDDSGTYDWLEKLDDIEGGDDWCPAYELIDGTVMDTLKLYYGDNHGGIRGDSLAVSILRYNIENRPGFMALRDGGAMMTAARDDIYAMIDKLQASVAFIRSRTDESEHNVIKLSDLTDIDADLPGDDPPNFAAQFNTIEDVLTWVESELLSPQGFEFTEDFGPYGTSYTIRIAPIVLIDGSIDDWKDLLPYYEWNLPEGDWFVKEVWGYGCYQPYMNHWSGDVWDGGACYWMEFNGLAQVCEYDVQYNWADGEPFILLDEYGEFIDLDTAYWPYFDDYTMGGLFPDMTTHDDWVEFMQIMQD